MASMREIVQESLIAAEVKKNLGMTGNQGLNHLSQESKC